jgi:hypothetical protein
MADSVGSALLIVLETLTPTERLAFVLHNLFGVPFEEISSIVGRSPRLPASWPAGPDGGCRELRRRGPIPLGNAK